MPASFDGPFQGFDCNRGAQCRASAWWLRVDVPTIQGPIEYQIPSFAGIQGLKLPLNRHPAAADQALDRAEGRLVGHFPAFGDPIAEVEIGQRQ